MQYTTNSLLKKHGEVMSEKKIEKSFGVFYLFSEKVTVEYDLGNFLYDSI